MHVYVCIHTYVRSVLRTPSTVSGFLLVTMAGTKQRAAKIPRAKLSAAA